MFSLSSDIIQYLHLFSSLFTVYIPFLFLLFLFFANDGFMQDQPPPHILEKKDSELQFI